MYGKFLTSWMLPVARGLWWVLCSNTQSHRILKYTSAQEFQVKVIFHNLIFYMYSCRSFSIQMNLDNVGFRIRMTKCYSWISCWIYLIWSNSIKNVCVCVCACSHTCMSVSRYTDNNPQKLSCFEATWLIRK